MKEKVSKITDIGNPKRVMKQLLQRIGLSYVGYSRMIGKPPEYISRKLNREDDRSIAISNINLLRLYINTNFRKGTFENELHYLLFEKQKLRRKGNVFEELNLWIAELEGKLSKIEELNQKWKKNIWTEFCLEKFHINSDKNI